MSGTFPHRNNKVGAEEIKAMVVLRRSGETFKVIAQKFGLSEAGVCLLLHGKRQAELGLAMSPEEIKVPRELTMGTRLTAPQVQEIHCMHRRGHSMHEIAKRFRVSSGSVWNVLHRKTWRHIEPPEDCDD